MWLVGHVVTHNFHIDSTIFLPTQACMVLQSVAEEVTQFYDDLDMEAKRQLLSTLTASLPMVLPFLTSTLEAQYQAVTVAGVDGAAKAHRNAVAAALGALMVVMYRQNDGGCIRLYG